MSLRIAVPNKGSLSLAATEILRIPGYPASIAVGAGAAWIVDSRRGTVTKVTQ